MADRIEKIVVLKAPMQRVWHAISDTAEFGKWFGVRLDGPFEEGRFLRGQFSADLAATGDDAGGCDQAANESLVFFQIERVEPPRRLVLRWILDGVDNQSHPEDEPMTRVTFLLEALDDGQTRLTITESGFEALPEERRKGIFRRNERGWAAQVVNLRKHVDGT